MNHLFGCWDRCSSEAYLEPYQTSVIEFYRENIHLICLTGFSGKIMQDSLVSEIIFNFVI